MINFSALKKFSRAKKYMCGAIITGNDMDIGMYVVMTGEAGIFVNYKMPNEKKIAVVSSGNFFGETALFLEKQTRYTAVALTNVIALPVSRTTVSEFFKEEPEMTFEIVKAMCERMDGVSTAFEALSGHPWVSPKAAPKETPAVPSFETVAAFSDVKKAPAVQDTNAQPATPVAPAPAPEAAKNISQSAAFSLFPENHGHYQLPLNNEDKVHMMEKGYTCPVCKNEFKALRVRSSKLVLDKMDSDMRNHYVGVEPLYYDVITCPKCLYSALMEMFENPDKTKNDLLSALQGITDRADLKFGLDLDTHTVFAGYYLALLCAPKCFVSQMMTTAKLLLKLSRIYQDCKDQQMENLITKQAYDAYIKVYENIELTPNQDQQICLIIGELGLKINDMKNARDFFYKAKTSRAGTPLLKRIAEDRYYDIRHIEG